MKKAWKKGLALAIALCSVFGLLLPLAGTANAAYTFPEYGPTTLLGEHIRGPVVVREFADYYTYGNDDYMLVPGYGGKLYVLRLSDYLKDSSSSDSWVYDCVDTGYSVPTGIDTSSDGKVYVIGGGNTVKIYTFGIYGKLETYTLPIDKLSISGISVDTYNNVYLAADKDGTGYVYRLRPDANVTGGYECTLLYSTTGLMGTAALVAGDRNSNDKYVYAQGVLTDGSSVIYKIHYTEGGLAGSVAYEKTGGIYYLSYADGKIFGGHSDKVGDGMIVVDTETMEKISIPVYRDGQKVTLTTSNRLNGLVPEPSADGTTYLNIAGVGLCKYDPKTDTATLVHKSVSCLRIRKLYNYGGHDCIMTIHSSTPYLYSPDDEASDLTMTKLVNGVDSNWTHRIMGTGATVDGEPVGPAAYVGGYLTPRVAGFDPDAEEPLNHTVFSQGHAQTDAMITYKGKIYAGCYSGGYLVEYDPATGAVVQLIPDGLYTDYYQARIHALAAGDDKIFFSTVPGTATSSGDSGLGGCIGWYDLTTGELFCKRNVVQDQILVTLAYDEENDILFGGSSVLGGSSSTPTQTEAYVMVYDVAAKSLLGNFSIRNAQNSNSDLGKWSFSESISSSSYYNTYKLHDNPPLCISGLSIDPDGKMWGNFYNTVFSCSYDKSANTLTVKREWYSGKTTGTPYSNSGSYSWFPRYFYFDDSYMYVVPRTGGLYRLNRSNPSSGAVQLDANCGRVYTMGSDGNLYYTDSYHLYRISLNRVSITEDLIYAADAEDQTSVDTAISAYEALTQEEKAQLGIYYQRKLNTLRGFECIVSKGSSEEYTSLALAMENADSSTTVTLLDDYNGNITVKNGAKLDIAGKTVTGSVAVANGTVVDSTNGNGGIVGALTLAPENPQLPLLDGATYRFFDFTAEVRMAAKDEKVINRINYWFDMRFTNTTAYTLLTGNSGLELYAELYLDGVKIDEDIVFSDVVKNWAAEDHTGEDDWALYVGVTNTPNRVDTVTVKPVLTSCGMTVTFGQVDHTVEHLGGQALFGAYPTDLIK